MLSLVVLALKGQNPQEGQPYSLGSGVTTVTPPMPLYAQTMTAKQIRSTSAILVAGIHYVDKQEVSFYFVYSYGNITRQATGEVNKNTKEITANVTGLPVNTEIKFWIVSKSEQGERKGVIKTFRTLPKNVNVSAHSRHADTFEGWATGFFNQSNLSGKKKKLVNACNYKNAIVRNKAVSIAAQSPGVFNLGQICDIFDYCYNGWHYVNDPIGGKNEIYQTASSTINNNLSGDCDDFAILICSMLLSVGGDARLNLAFSGTTGHAFTEINMGKVDMKVVADYIAARYKGVWTGAVHYRVDQNKNCWMNLDWWAKHPGGHYYKADRGTRFYILDNYCEDY